MPIIGLMRIKNEARWIRRVIASIRPICERIIVLDDHSIDGTPTLAREAGAIVHDSQFSDTDESRDKDWLLDRAYEVVPREYHLGSEESPWFALMIDGDEELVARDQVYVITMANAKQHVWSFKVLYLWNTESQIRVDGVYKNFARPSLFRLMNQSFRFQRTPYGNNFHCSSVPQEMLHSSHTSEARLLHYGYLHREDRIRKYHWYNRLDPDNPSEDGYRHMVVGDIFPESSHFKHAGPLKLEALHV